MLSRFESGTIGFNAQNRGQRARMANEGVWDMTNDGDGSDGADSDCSIAPVVPRIPSEAVEFSKSVAALAERYGISDVAMTIEVDTGYGSRYQDRDFPGEKIVERMKVNVSRKDGRGRPRTQIYVQAEMHVSVPVVWEPNSIS